MTDEQEDHPHALVGKLKEAVGAVLHNEELITEGQLEQEEAAEQAADENPGADPARRRSEAALEKGVEEGQ